MLKGVDISRWQKGKIDKEFIDKQDFVIMKASEGKSSKDSMLDKWYDMVHGYSDGEPDQDKCYGFYHYARPEKYTALEEAKNFLKLVRHHAGEAIFALDWEYKALDYPIERAKEWMDIVYTETGVRPVIYIQGSKTKDCDIIAQANYGLWVAHWNATKPNIGAWDRWAIWQYKVDMNPNVDLDYFNGTKEQWKKYCRRS